MKFFSKKRWLYVAAAVAVVVVVMGGPVETWLECRERQFTLLRKETLWLAAGTNGVPGFLLRSDSFGGQVAGCFTGKDAPDAVYLVAGSRDQSRRVDALVDFVGKYSNSGSTDTPILVLVGNDRLKSKWSSEDQRNLTKAEWGARRIKERMQYSVSSIQPALRSLWPGSVGLGEEGYPVSRVSNIEGGVRNEESGMTNDGYRIQIVPGRFSGTDGEMEALAQYLENQHEVKSLALVTSPFHIRRALGRLDVYLHRDIKVSAIAAKAKWTDRAPWTVLGELFKMGRDFLGLSRCRLLSRGDGIHGDRSSP